MAKKITKIGYVPTLYTDDGTNIGWIDLIDEDKCFMSEDDALDWCYDNGYDEEDINISEVEFTDDDMEFIV